MNKLGVENSLDEGLKSPEREIFAKDVGEEITLSLVSSFGDDEDEKIHESVDRFSSLEKVIEFAESLVLTGLSEKPSVCVPRPGRTPF